MGSEREAFFLEKCLMMDIGCSHYNFPVFSLRTDTQLESTGRGQPMAGSFSLLDILEALESPGERTKAQSALKQRSAGHKTRDNLRHSPAASIPWSWAHLSSPSSPPTHKCSTSVSRSSYPETVFPFVTLRSVSFLLTKHSC